MACQELKPLKALIDFGNAAADAKVVRAARDTLGHDRSLSDALLARKIAANLEGLIA